MVEAGAGAAWTGRWLTGLSVLLVGTGCTPMDDVLQSWFGRSMRQQSSLEAYENPLAPPEGSVPFAAGNFPPGPGSMNIGQPAVAEIPEPATQIQLFQQSPEVTGIPNPVAATPASLARGETMFNRACSPCHGTAGDGTGPVARSGIPPFSILTPQVMAFTDGYIYTLIRIGRAIMPPYGHQISHYDRWHIVNYVRQLQGQLGQAQQAGEPAGPAEEE